MSMRRRRRRDPAERTSLVPRGKYIDARSLNSGIRRRHIEYIRRVIEVYHLTRDSLEAAFTYVPVSEVKKFIDTVYDPAAVDEDGDRDDNQDECVDNIFDPDDLARYMLEDVMAGRLLISESEFVREVDAILEKEYRAIPSGKRDELDRRIQELSEVFRFDDAERSILAALFSIYEVQTDVVEDLVNDMEYPEFLRFMSVVTGISLRRVKQVISKRGTLFRSGILTKINHNRRDFIEFEDQIAEYLSGIGDVSLTERFIKRDKRKVLPLDFFDLDDTSMDTMRSLLADENPCNILLAGVAGTGKTEFARSLGRATGKPVFTLNVGGSERNRSMSLRHDEENTMYVSFRAAEELVATAGGILIADEMDVMLNDAEKGWLNLYLDSSRAKIIWITNNLHYVQESTMRRFQYVEYFGKLTSRDRAKIWRNQLKGHFMDRILSGDEVKALAREHHVNAGGISHALSTLSRMKEADALAPTNYRRTLEHLLDRHRQQITKNFSTRRSALNSLESSYDPAILHTSQPVEGVTATLREMSQRLLSGSAEEQNMNLLFSGRPGTGKTEYVKYLARESGLELLVRRYSDIESPWVGQAEKNIAQAFREAERGRAILFMDEADSLFTSRDSARHSWEVSRTNELLTQMENFTGIFIAATNFMPQMDSAAMRRFQWKIEFWPMKKEKRLRLYRRFFDYVAASLSSEEERRIAGIDGLTPGDMKAVRERLKFMPAAEQNHNDIIAALEEEQRYKDFDSIATVGFSR